MHKCTDEMILIELVRRSKQAHPRSFWLGALLVNLVMLQALFHEFLVPCRSYQSDVFLAVLISLCAVLCVGSAYKIWCPSDPADWYLMITLSIVCLTSVALALRTNGLMLEWNLGIIGIEFLIVCSFGMASAALYRLI